MQRGRGVARRTRQNPNTHLSGETWNNSLVLPLIEQSRRCVAVPAVPLFEPLHEFATAGFAQARRRAALKLLRHDAVDAPAVVAAVQVEVLLEVRRE